MSVGVHLYVCMHVYLHVCACVIFLDDDAENDNCAHYTFTLNSCVAVNYAWNVR